MLHAILHSQLELLYIDFCYVYGPRFSLQTIVFQELSDQVSSLHAISEVAFHDCLLIIYYLTIKYYYTYCFKINLQPSVSVSQS
jgi:hypothetical protein